MAKSSQKKTKAKAKKKPSAAAQKISKKKKKKSSSLNKKLSKSESKKVKAKKKDMKSDAVKFEEQIVIDEEKNLVFQSEDDLYEHFKGHISDLEKEFNQFYDKNTDFSQKEFDEFEEQLLELLSEPDQIYEDEYRLPGIPLKQYVKSYSDEKMGDYHYIALVYLSVDTPTFVFLHFPTKDPKLLAKYTNAQVFYDVEQDGTDFEEVDALAEGDELAVGLYKAMLTLRGENDIPVHDFQSFTEYRSEGIEEADEIWRTTDLNGNTLVNFIKDLSEGEESLFYVSVAVEDESTDSHYLLFSFPTRDKSILERYRHGDNLNAEEEGEFSDDEESH
ncbi:MAG: peptidase [Bdellovibrionales bacterium]